MPIGKSMEQESLVSPYRMMRKCWQLVAATVLSVYSPCLQTFTKYNDILHRYADSPDTQEA
jgi:hypothetical protein